ncbi:hypothetical protein [Acinetobacter nectaris]|uniref:hypothetical protein n=1 Tax=Acinetobacter nectaris TaxID=1219382 RepID=UPI001F1E9AC4|nr:hypothetical protein [Acinetobacter nectaris]MCF9045591.1 hypothetical protein [Acinetobacter nectaris]
MNTEINSFSEINAWLYKNYNIYCVDCDVIVCGINIILSVIIDQKNTYFIEIFHHEKSSTIEREGNLNNFLIKKSISAAKAITHVSGTLSSYISIQGWQRSVLIFEHVKARRCLKNEDDIKYCAKPLYRLFVGSSLPIFDAVKHYNDT